MYKLCLCAVAQHATRYVLTAHVRAQRQADGGLHGQLDALKGIGRAGAVAPDELARIEGRPGHVRGEGVQRLRAARVEDALRAEHQRDVRRVGAARWSVVASHLHGQGNGIAPARRGRSASGDGRGRDGGARGRPG